MPLPLVGIVVQVSSALLALGLAAFVLGRNPRAWTNRWLALGLSVIGVHQALMTASIMDAAEPRAFSLVRLGTAAAAMIPASWLAFSLVFGQSNGRSALARWQPSLLATIVVIPVCWIGLIAGHIIQPTRLTAAGPVLVGLDTWGKVYFSMYLVGLALVLLHLENLYRHATHLVRWKIKFLVVGVFLAFGYQVVAVSYALLYGLLHPLHQVLGAVAFLLGQGLIAFSLLRHRLLDIDVFVSRYVIYRSLTLAVIGVYLIFLGLAAEVFHLLKIPLDLVSGPFLALLGATVVSFLLLSDTIRRRVQRVIHTHFYKHKYDYRVEWMEYTHRLSRVTTIHEIAAQTVNRILEVMWVRQAAMYTPGDTPNALVLSHQIGYDTLPAALDLSNETRDALRKEAEQLASAAAQGQSAEAAASIARRLFGEIPVGFLVPVSALDTMVGLLVVGPELSGKPFGVDDWDLLVAVAAQAGALILNARLAREASEGRELQVLARLSAFVAHDLKNAASTLSMLADNAKHHIDEPEFQADAIRTLGDVTTRMRNLLVTLTSPGARPHAKPGPTALAPTTEGWVREMATLVPSRIRLETRLGCTPDVSVEPDKLRSVLQNLVLNAVEAIPDTGTILVETLTEDGAAVLKVNDTGRGMSPDFIRERLFRPFQTTKARGLGIGLYQCRQIVQQFGGSLAVESEEGKGTRMIVRLPVLPSSPPGH